MGQALYRKHRPKSLLDVVGQEHITTTLSHALKQDKISHAYLFTGPRGTGKTSVARILAHEANNLPYNDDHAHLDIIEIDAASNRRIDEIRDLRDKVNNAPALATYKVYIIDEVHMLTREAFNALLKTLEEPPAHVIFILATTEAHKLPETIISRTQRFAFKPVPSQQVIAHLKTIAEAEHISVDQEALELISDHGNGSFRDSISLLDQASANSKAISLQDIQRLLGLAADEIITELLSIIEQGTPSELIEQLDTIRSNGIEPIQLSRQLIVALRKQMIQGNNLLAGATITSVMQQLLDINGSINPQARLEITLLDIVLNRPGFVSPHPQIKVAASTPKVIENVAEALPTSPTTPSTPPKSSTATLVTDETWQKALLSIKKQHNTLYSLARMAVPQFNDSEIILSFGFPFHQKRLNETKNKIILGEVLKELTGNDFVIKCIVETKSTPSAPNTKKPEPAVTDNTLETISNIFGPTEVLES